MCFQSEIVTELNWIETFVHAIFYVVFDLKSKNRDKRKIKKNPKIQNSKKPKKPSFDFEKILVFTPVMPTAGWWLSLGISFDPPTLAREDGTRLYFKIRVRI